MLKFYQNRISASRMFAMHINAVTFVIGMLAVIFISSAANAATYYVSNSTGNDSRTVAQAQNIDTPWATIQKAASIVSAGDTVYIKAGTYSGNIVMSTSGSYGTPITFEGYKTTPGDNPAINYILENSLSPNDMPLLDGSSRATAGTAITLTGCDYIIIKNLQIQNYNIGVYGYSSEYCTIENITAIALGDPNNSYDGTGIVMGSYGNNNTVKNCIVANACAEGITVLGNTNIIENCKVYCNDARSVDAAMDYYITVAGNYNSIIGCYVERVGDLPHSGHGIQFKGDAEYNLVKDCVSKNQGTCFGVRHRGVRYNVFENCTAIGTGVGTPSGGLIVRDGASYNTFKNCRTLGVNYATLFFDTTEDGGAQSAGFNNNFENCIFDGTIDYCIAFNYYDTASAAYNNNFVNCTFNGGNYLFQSQRENYGNAITNCIITRISNLVNVQDPYSLYYTCTYSNFYNNGFAAISGTGNFSGNPLFKDLANGDLHLTAGSPCINAGNAVSLSDDYDYIARPQGSGYDIGAYEYAGKLVYLKLNENTGSTVQDQIGSLTAGTISGATWTTGQSGSALNFDGINDYVNFGNQAVLNMTGSRSISAWIKPAQNNSYNTIVSKYLWGYSLFTCSGKLRAYVSGSTTAAYSQSNESVNTGVWQHVAMTFNIIGDKKIHLYINGQEVTYSTQTAMVGSPVTSNDNFVIGSDTGTRYWFNGAIDEVKVFTRQLSAVEIFDECTTNFSADLNGGIGTAVNDNSIYGNNGTISGATWVTGKSGRTLDFDGINDYVDFGNPAVLNMTGSRSISAWIKPVQNNEYNTITAKDIWGFSLFTSYGKLRAYVNGSTTAAYSQSNTSVTIGEWQHVAMTFDVNGDKKVHLYINGTEVTYSTQTAMVGNPVTNTSNFAIGASAGTCCFNGAIDEVKVFARALSAGEIFKECAPVFFADLNEGIGDNVNNDNIIYGNKGTRSGATWTTGGKSGNALSFDGTNDYVNFGTPAVFNMTGSRSISAWIKPVQNNTYNTIVSKYVWGYSLFTSSGKLCAYVSGSTTGAYSQSNESVSTGAWQHVAMTFDVNGDKKIHLYINGQEVTYSTQTAMVGSPVTSSNNFSIGSDTGTRYWFNGAIDEVKVYDIALSATVVNNIYQY